MKTISIIIPTYNRNKVLCDTINSIINQCELINKKYIYELIIVDQTETHDIYTKDYIENLRKYSFIKYIHTSIANLPNARNIGIKQAVGSIIVFLDDDVLLHDDFFDNLLLSYQDYNIMSVVGKPLLKNQSGENILLSNQSLLKKCTKIILQIIFGGGKTSIISKYGPILLNTESSKVELVDAGRGCCMSFRKEVFDIIGYFDSNYIGNALREETDLFCRMKKAHMKVLFNPLIIVDHLMADDGGCRAQYSEKYWVTYFSNQFYFYLKNFTFSKMYIKLLLLFDIIKLKKNKIDVGQIIDLSYKRSVSLLQNK